MDNSCCSSSSSQGTALARVRSLVRSVPAAINGMALCSAGAGVMYRNLASIYHVDEHVEGLVLALLLWSLLLTALYLAKVLLFPRQTFAEDCTLPGPLASIGALAMALNLQGALFSLPVLRIPQSVAVAWVVFGATVQLISMSAFFRACIRTRTGPEPFWNAAVLSCLFPCVALPGSSLGAQTFRNICFLYGALCSVLYLPTSTWRLLTNPSVASNPSCAIFQAAMSITCSAWIVSPVTGDASSGIGKKVTHIVFALSTLGFAITITALWQRREALMRLGHHTSWAALTFPFANTAIAAGLYVHALKARHNVALQVWMFVLTVLASVIIAGVTLMYLANGLFLSVETKEHQNTDVVDMPEGDSTSHGEPSSDTSNVGSNTGSTSAPCGVIEILPLP